MTIEETARKIREAIFERAEDDGGVVHASSIEDEIVKVLKAEQPAHYGYGVMSFNVHDGKIAIGDEYS